MAVKSPLPLKLALFQLPHTQGLPLPRYETSGAAGFDLAAAVPEDAPLTLASGGRVLVPTGLIFQLPAGFEAQIRPRSGLALKHGVTVLNAPGTIDADYRGEVQVLLINHGQADYVISRGMRIAQAIIAPVIQMEIIQAQSMDETPRGAGGFGSTGV